MIYLIVLLILFGLELAYFYFAKSLNIVDRPNERSSHTKVTLRGGGIVFYFAGVCYFILSGFQYPFFFIGLSMMSIVSLIDDIRTLSNKIRLIIHFVAVSLMIYQLEVINLQWTIVIGIFIVVVGAINAYNFMDGINGMTVCYSISLTLLLLIVNKTVSFIDSQFLIFTLISLGVFAIFNFRIKAIAFAGDVGSVSIAFMLLFALGCLIIKTGNVIYILFLSVYGIDTVWTILGRLRMRQNIFQAHRSHLYQYLVNEANFNKLWISFFYGFLNFLIGISVISIANLSVSIQSFYSISLLLLLSSIYLIVKSVVMRKFVLNN